MEKHHYTKEEINRVGSLLDELKHRGVNNLERFETKLTLYIPQREQFRDTRLEGNTAQWVVKIIFSPLCNLLLSLWPISLSIVKSMASHHNTNTRTR